MNAFKKSVSPLAKVFCDIEYTADGKLSISGNMPNGGGQINSTLREMPEEEREYMPGWNAETFNRFLDVWDVWHLNDMRAGCEHQRAEKWGEEEIDLCNTELHTARLEKLIATRTTSPAYLQATRDQYHREILKMQAECEQGNKPEINNANRRDLIKSEAVTIKTERKCSTWVRETEHPKGVLSKPCPVCGYEYGSKWLREEVPEDVLSFLVSLPDSGIDPGDSHNEQARAYLKKTGTKFSTRFIEYGAYFDDDKERGESRDIYRVTLSRNGKRYSFKFGQSLNDSDGGGGNPPSAYTVLSCLTKYDPENFENFCSEFGYETDSRKALKTYKAVQHEYDRLSEMFTDAELEEMQEIN